MTSNKTCSICLEEILDEKNIFNYNVDINFMINVYINTLILNKKSCHCPFCRQNFMINLKDRKP